MIIPDEWLNDENIYSVNDIESIYGKILVSAIKNFDDLLVTFEGRLADIEVEINKLYEEKKLDPNQYEQLKQQIEKNEQHFQF